METDYIDTFLRVQKALHKDSYGNGWSIGKHPSLSMALCKLQGLTSCSGTFSAHYSYYTHSNIENKIKVNNRNAGTIWKPDVKVLLEEAKPAPFGKGEQTVFDESVRKGLQIPASELHIENLDYLVPEDIDYLVPNNYKFHAKLYKMHIYLPGGHFELHRDTPHAANHLATLVVALPSCFQGGHLTLMDYKEVKSFPLGSLPLPESPPEVETDHSTKPLVSPLRKHRRKTEEAKDLCHWVAFYTDVEHKVEPVLSGTRVVLQFDLLAIPDERDEDDEEDEPMVEIDKDTIVPKREMLHYVCGSESKEGVWISKDRESGAESQTVIKDIASELDKLLKKDPVQKFALVLKHRYTTKSLKPELLKSVDQLLWTELSQTFDISIMPVLIEESGDYEDGCTSFTAKPFDLYSLDKDEKKEDKCKTWVITGSRESEALHMFSQSYIEHTGNEAQPAEEKYLVSCLIVHKIKDSN